MLNLIFERLIAELSLLTNDYTQKTIRTLNLFNFNN